jgi:hypothetical protein
MARLACHAACMLFLAESYLPAGASVAEFVRQARAAAARAAATGNPVSFRQAIFVPQDECCYALFEARAAADVTTAGALAGLEFDRVSLAVAVVQA